MHNKLLISLFILLFCCLQSRADNKQWGVGLLGAWPIGGITAYYNTSNVFTLQVGIDPFGYDRGLFFRGLYRFHNERIYSAYGFASIGIWSYKFQRTSLGLAGGVGMEFFLEEIIEGNFPTLSLAPELGAGLVNFGEKNEMVLYPYLGLGIYYRF